MPAEPRASKSPKLRSNMPEIKQGFQSCFRALFLDFGLLEALGRLQVNEVLQSLEKERVHALSSDSPGIAFSDLRLVIGGSLSLRVLF